MIRNSDAAQEVLQRLNYGMLFKHVGTLQPASDFWMQTFQIVLPDKIYLNQTKVRCNIPNSEGCKPTKKLFDVMYTIKANAQNHLNGVIEEIEQIVPQVVIPTSRSTRSILPFIGDLSKTLFGTASERDVQLLAKHIQALEDRDKTKADEVEKLENHFSSYMSTFNHRLDNLDGIIQDNHQALTTLAKEFREHNHDFEVYFKAAYQLSEEIVLASSMHDQIENLLIGLHALLKGQLTPRILPVETIMHVYNNINSMVQIHHPRFKLATLNSQEIYSDLEFLVNYKNRSLYVSLKFPLLSTLDIPMSIYETSVLPLPVNNSAHLMTQLTNIPKYFGISKDMRYYITLDEFDSHHTHNRVTHVPRKSITDHSCILALYLKDKKLVHELCSFSVVKNSKTPYIDQLYPGLYVVSNVQDISLSCSDPPETHEGCSLCIVKFPCDCDIVVPPFHIPPVISQCVKDNSLVKYHPVNLAVLQHFYDESKLLSIEAETMLNVPSFSPIPDIKLFKHNISQQLATDKSLQVDLRRLADAVKQDKTVFSELAEPILDSLDSITTESDSISQYAAYAAVAVAVLDLMICVFLYFRIQSVNVLIAQAAMRQPASVSATDVKAITLFPISLETPKPDLHTEWMQSILPWIMFGTLALSLVLIGQKLYKFICTPRVHTSICVVFSQGKHCLKIPITNLIYCPSYLHFKTTETLLNFEIIGRMAPTLACDWGDLEINNLLSNHKTFLPNEIPVSRLMAMRVRKLLIRPFHAQLVCEHDGRIYVPRLCPIFCTQCTVATVMTTKREESEWV